MLISGGAQPRPYDESVKGTMMKLKCQDVYASEVGGEMYEVMFEAKGNPKDGPYLIIQRNFLEEEDGRPGPYYLETNDLRLIGLYPTLIYH